MNPVRHLLMVCAMVVLSAGFAHAGDLAGGYMIGPDDVMEITVYGEKDLSKSYKVTQGGSISMPLIGEVKVAGVSLSEAEGLIREKLADGYLIDPSVAIQISSSRPFYIMGEVRNPGSYPYASNMTVLNAVALAGGFTYRARESEIELTRGEGSEHVAVEERIAPGDVILVQERFF